MTASDTMLSAQDYDLSCDLANSLATETWAAALAKAVTKQKTGGMIFLYGDLGCGKTTLVRGLLRAMGYKDYVPSPSYTLLEHYPDLAIPVLHFDLYRLHSGVELEEIGFRDYWQYTPRPLFMVEWPERAKDYLPTADLSIYLEFNKALASPVQGRLLHARAHGNYGHALLKACDYQQTK